MPTYEYMCENCEHKFEQFQSITAKPLRTCPKCKKRKLKRLIGTGAGVIFKGSGFYETDYRSESYKKAKESEKKSTDKNTGKKDSETKTTESKSEGSKPAKKNKSTKNDKNKTA
jgi:putative FmdB family regulatory protein